METATSFQRGIVLVLRVALGWVFLWAGIRQVFLISNWSALEFLQGAKTFKDFYAFFAAPAVVPTISVLVKWGHLLLGISLILGVLVRVGGSVGAVLVMLYYFPRVEFPYVGGMANLIVEYHVVLALILVYLVSVGAGRIYGLDGWLAGSPAARSWLEKYPRLKPLFSQ